jgi:hypothetical protein
MKRSGRLERKPWFTLVLLLCVYAAACGQLDEVAQPVLEGGTPFEVDSVPMLRVGVSDGDTLQEFFQVTTPFIYDEARLAVPLGGANSIRVFDVDGSFIRSVGRQGEGPGELAALNSAWARGDTIEAGDGRPRRITRFRPDGTVEVVSLRGEAVPETVPVGAMEGGWITAGVEPGPRNDRDVIIIHGFARDGSHLGEVARTEGIRRMAGGPGVDPLSPRAVVRVVMDGIYVGETETPQVRVYDLNGDVQREIGWDPAGRLDPAVALRMVQEAPDPSPMFEPLLSEAQVPGRVSVFWDFLVDELGFLWVRPYEPMGHAAALGGLGGGPYLTSPAGGGGRWLVFSSSGEARGSVEIPEGVGPIQITSDALVGIRIDALGVESVQVHQISRH